MKHKTILYYDFLDYVPRSLSPNIKVVEWLPQNDLLGHKDIKAFVSHAGHNSVYESAYHGVPVVAVPLFADQFSNAKKVEQFGLGIAVDHETVDAHQLFKTIERVATEPRYTNLLQMFYNLLKSTTFQLVAWRKIFYPNHIIDVDNRISSHIELKIGVPATKSGKL